MTICGTFATELESGTSFTSSYRVRPGREEMANVGEDEVFLAFLGAGFGGKANLSAPGEQLVLNEKLCRCNTMIADKQMTCSERIHNCATTFQWLVTLMCKLPCGSLFSNSPCQDINSQNSLSKNCSLYF